MRQGKRHTCFSLFVIVAALVSTSVPTVRASLPIPEIALNRTVYSVGESVSLGIRVLTTLGTPTPITGLRLVFNTPGGVITYNVGAINSDIWYTLTVSGVTNIPGTCSVRAQLGTEASSTLSFSVVSGPGFGFDFAIILSPAAQTVEQGGTATFRILITYSSPAFSGTLITIQVTGLGLGMDWRSTTSGDLYISTSPSTPAGTYTIVVVGSARGVIHQTSASLTVGSRAPPFDFSVSISPSTQTVSIGDKTSFSVAVNLISGTSATASLTLSGLPAGLGYSFSPQSGTPSFTSTLTVDASAALSTGTYTFTLTASGGGLSRTATAGITVKEAPDFTLSVSPDTVTLKQGEKASFNIAVNPVAGFDKLVTLSVTGLPTGASAVFTVPSGRPPLISTLTITVPDSVQEGGYSLSVDAAGDVKIHSMRIMLNVERKPTLLEQLFGPGITALIPFVVGAIVLLVVIAAVVLVMSRRGARVTAKAGAPTPAAPPSSATKFCMSCGASIPKTAKHCSKCGAAQE